MDNPAPPPPVPVRVGPLNDARGVRREIVRLYRAARNGEIDTKDASRLTQMLNVLLGSIRTDDIEGRLSALEAKSS